MEDKNKPVAHPQGDGVNWKAVANEQMGIIQALKVDNEKLAGDRSRLSAELETLRVSYKSVLAQLDAGQPQGEPVALTNAQQRAADHKEQQAFNDWAFNKSGEAIGRMDGNAAAMEAWHARAKLAEQPAQVAVTTINYGALDPVERLAVCRGK